MNGFKKYLNNFHNLFDPYSWVGLCPICLQLSPISEDRKIFKHDLPMDDDAKLLRLPPECPGGGMNPIGNHVKHLSNVRMEKVPVNKIWTINEYNNLVIRR